MQVYITNRYGVFSISGMDDLLGRFPIDAITKFAQSAHVALVCQREQAFCKFVDRLDACRFASFRQGPVNSLLPTL